MNDMSKRKGRTVTFTHLKKDHGTKFISLFYTFVVTNFLMRKTHSHIQDVQKGLDIIWI